MAAHHIFLSYSRRDKELMEQVYRSLYAAGLNVWTDRGIKPGTRRWKKAIQDAIENTRCLVVLLSPDSKESEWVNRELDYADLHGKPIFPIMVRGDERNSVPFSLVGSQYVDIRSAGAYEPSIQQLTDAVREYLQMPAAKVPSPQVATPTPAQQRPAATATPPSQPLQGSASDSQQMARHAVQRALQRQQAILENPPEAKTPLTIHLWNPLHILRLAWWVFITPHRLDEDKYELDDSFEISIGMLVGLLVWLPLLIGVLGLNSGAFPDSDLPLGLSRAVVAVIAVIGWILTTGINFIVDYDLAEGDSLLALAFTTAAVGVVAMSVAHQELTASGVVLFAAMSLLTTGIAQGMALGAAFELMEGLGKGAGAGIAIGTGYALVHTSLGESLKDNLYGTMPDNLVMPAATIIFIAAAFIVAIVIVQLISTVAAFTIEEYHFGEHKSTLPGKGFFILLLAGYAVIVWLYLLEGWFAFV